MFADHLIDRFEERNTKFQHDHHFTSPEEQAEAMRRLEATGKLDAGAEEKGQQEKPSVSPPAAAVPAAAVPASQNAEQTTEKPTVDKGGFAICMHDYAKDEADEVSIKKGQRIEVLDKVSDPDWWLGRVVESGEQGTFPSNFVKLET
jgi:hypothetical protein